MSTSRPSTPVAISDSSSDPGSLSDLDSSWTDLESNRSGGHHSPSTTSDAGSEEARSATERYEGEAWEGINSEGDEGGEHNVGDDTFHSESRPAADTVHSPSFQQGISELTLENWVADAVGSSLLSDDDSLQTSTPHLSIHGSRAALRLAFPDPLSNSEDNLVLSRALSRTQSRSTEAASELGSCGAPNETLSSVRVPSPTEMLHSGRSCSVPEDEQESPKSEEYYDQPSELTPTAVSYALSIVLLGHPPLPHLKSTIVSVLIDMVAVVLGGSPHVVLGGSPHVSESSGATRIYEVPVHMPPPPKTHSAIAGNRTHRILISDHTSGAMLLSSFDTVDFPTLALIFMQPPLPPPAIPSLPLNTRYLPLLLPSVSDIFASSLLDLSPSVLFDHSVPNISTPDDTPRKIFALKQCEEMGILRRRLGEAEEVLTVDEFVGIPADRIPRALRDLLNPPNNASKESREEEALVTTDGGQSGLGVIRKHVVIVSALFVAFLFGLAVFLRGTPLIPSHSNGSYSNGEVTENQKVWSFLHPFVNRTSRAVPTVSSPSPAASELSRTHVLSPASLKSLAVSVFRSELAVDGVTGTSTSLPSRPEKRGNKARQISATEMTDGRHQASPASIDAPVSPSTLDPPSTRSVSPIPPPQDPGPWMGKDKETVNSPTLPTPVTSLSTRISNALSPFFNAINHDLREIEEAIDALLHALLQLKGQASEGIGELVHVLSTQLGHGTQVFAGKVHRAAQSVGEEASKRHARARHNARQVRDVGEWYVNVAKQKFERGIERARGNARGVLIDGLAMGRRESRKLRRQAREQRKTARTAAWQKRKESKQKMRGTELIFHSVMAFIA